MSRRTARILAGVFFLAYTVALTWPGTLPFNRIRPLVLGLPFNMAWVALWVTAACVVLFLLDRIEEAHPDPETDGSPAPGPAQEGS